MKRSSTCKVGRSPTCRAGVRRATRWAGVSPSSDPRRRRSDSGRESCMPTPGRSARSRRRVCRTRGDVTSFRRCRPILHLALEVSVRWALMGGPHDPAADPAVWMARSLHLNVTRTSSPSPTCRIPGPPCSRVPARPASWPSPVSSRTALVPTCLSPSFPRASRPSADPR